MAPRKISRCRAFDATREEIDLARRRTDFLLGQPQRSLQDLIANAYLQGILDVGEYLNNKSELRKDAGQ